MNFTLVQSMFYLSLILSIFCLEGVFGQSETEFHDLGEELNVDDLDFISLLQMNAELKVNEYVSSRSDTSPQVGDESCDEKADDSTVYYTQPGAASVKAALLDVEEVAAVEAISSDELETIISESTIQTLTTILGWVVRLLTLVVIIDGVLRWQKQQLSRQQQQQPVETPTKDTDQVAEVSIEKLMTDAMSQSTEDEYVPLWETAPQAWSKCMKKVYAGNAEDDSDGW